MILLLAGLLERHDFRLLLVTWAALQGLFYLSLSRGVQYVIASLAMPSAELPLILEMLAAIRENTFSSRKLAGIAQRLGLACDGLTSLRNLILFLEQRTRRQGFLPLAYCLLWGTQFSMAVERWRRRHRGSVLEWIETLGEFEALMCIATYSFEHPGDPFPEIAAEPFGIFARGIAHPLLDETVAIRNDVELNRDVRFLVISGSNMSGKSTFLRALGLNAVLSFMGAPVRCAELRLVPMTIAAAIRVEDDLPGGKSRFFAEMLRLNDMVTRAREEPLLFLVDEIMSGTNSEDRRVASQCVIEALVSSCAIGVVSTHDLSLTEMASGNGKGRNFHFRDIGEQGEMRYDYRMYSGVIKRSNALNIARLLGLDVPSFPSALKNSLSRDDKPESTT